MQEESPLGAVTTTAPLRYPLDATRAHLADRIKRSAGTAVHSPTDEQSSRLDILGYFLDPAADVVNRAISRWESGGRFATLDRERIADYITRALERAVLGVSRTPVNLQELANAGSPFAWSDRFASACVQSGITEVRRAHGREVGADLHQMSEAAPLRPVASIGWADRILSAEDVFLARERSALITELTETVESWTERQVSIHQRNVERAAALRSLLDLPVITITGQQRRSLHLHLSTDAAAAEVRTALQAHRDLAAGEPDWHRHGATADLMDIWVDFTAAQAEALLAAPGGAVMLIASDACAFEPRPREPHRLAVRRVLKDLSGTTGWSSLVMRLERAWAAEFFDARVRAGAYDTRDDAEAEADRARDAGDWDAAARAALAFRGTPLGQSVRSTDDVAELLLRTYRLVDAAAADAPAATAA